MKLPLLLRKPLRRLLSPQGRWAWVDQQILTGWTTFNTARTLLRHPFEAPLAGNLRIQGESPNVYDPEFYRQHASTSLLPFWAHFSVDHVHGGFITHLDRTGQIYGDGSKSSSMQARMIYAFTVGHEWLGDPTYLQLAQQGVDFLIKKMWDSQHGGWYEAVHREGRVKISNKYLFDQAYVLIGLGEYVRVTQDNRARDSMLETYALLEKHTWDAMTGGYHERYQADWTMTSSAKTICVQLDMLLAALTLYSATNDVAFQARALELADIVAGHMLNVQYGCVLETFTPDWRYNPVPTRDQLQIGHNLKAAWLLLRLSQVTNRPNYVPVARQLLDYSLRHGWDAEHGGFYQFLFRNGLRANDEKQWWAMCEGMQALLLMYQISHEQHYLDTFVQLTEFTFKHFTDYEVGEWVHTCYPNGNVKDSNKGSSWKAAYHTVQTCHELYQMLSHPVGALHVSTGERA
jgi:mannose 2-epimerase